MKLKITLILCSCALLLSAQQKPSQEWLDRKFSMFIHFGLYSVYGGVYEGEPVRRGYSEQIQSFAGIFSDWYGNTSHSFNPVNWNPDSIVALAKEAGMRSIVFTSKHHDGFCMYHSVHTKYNIVDATPYGRDLMKELSEACERGGIAFGVYYSLIDWHYPHAYPISSHNADPLTPEHYAFNMKQVEEIMTHYGTLSEIWFDMGSLTPEQSKGLYELVDRLQPQCMISGRLGNDYVDFSVMADNEYPDYQIGLPWQTAASMFDETWSYRSWQERGEVQSKVNEKIKSLIQVISRGGNFLLNIGPKGDGALVPFEKEVLSEIGKWMDVNKEGIYGTTANPYHHSFPWGDITTKENAFFAFVERMPSSRSISLPPFNGEVQKVTLLSTGQILPHRYHKEGMDIDLSDVVTDELIPVLKVAFKNGYSVDAPTTVAVSDILTQSNATSLFGHSSLNYYAGYKTVIGYDWVLSSRRRSLSPQITFTDSEKGRTVVFEIDDHQQVVSLQPDMTETVRLPEGTVKWGNIYRKPGRGVFGTVDEEGVEMVDVDAEDARWTAVDVFRYGGRNTEAILPRGSVVFLQELISKRDQNVAVKIESGNAVYILLNGEYITAHFSPTRIEHQEEIVLLPLREGANQLVIKFYNGYNNQLSYGITPLEEWSVHTRKLSPITIEGNSTHPISLRGNNMPSNVSPMRLHNISVKLR